MTAHGYDDEYYEKIYGKELKRFGSHWWAVRFYSLIAGRIMRRIGGRKVLEIGCGHGYILANLAESYEVWGVDLSEYAVGQCARTVPAARVRLADVEKGLPEELVMGDFDLAIAKYVFEHLKDPASAMREVGRALKPGGVLFYSVPNLKCPGARLKGPEWYANTDPTHVSLLQPEEWLKITESAGFRIMETFSDGFWDLPYWKGVPRFFQLPLLMPTAFACLTGSRAIPASWGENILVIAEKVRD